MSRRKKVLFAGLIFITAFAVRSIHAVDLAPVMYSADQPMGGLAETYDFRARSILKGDGLLFPRGIGPRDTGLLSITPGYPILLAAEYKVLGDDYFNVQLVQSFITSIICVVLFFFCGPLISWRVGLVAGFIAAIAHSIAYYSTFITPDSLCALPIIIAVWLVALSLRARAAALRLNALAGVLLGLSVWLRPNSLLLAVFLGAAILVIRRPRRLAVWCSIALLAASVLTVLPITIRNYVIYRRFVPVSINLGIVLWEGIGEMHGGDRFGAVKTDVEVGRQDVERYNNPDYSWWAAPDGIDRDRDRVRRSLGVIIRHPVWYLGVIVSRMRGMLSYAGNAPMIRKPSEGPLGNEHRDQPDLQTADSGPHGQPADRSALRPGEVFALLRYPFRSLQRLAKETLPFTIFVGAVAMLALTRRRWLLVAAVPIYYLVCQSAMHTEFRYTLPMHYFLFIFSAITWVLLAGALYTVFRTLFRKQKRAG